MNNQTEYRTMTRKQSNRTLKEIKAKRGSVVRPRRRQARPRKIQVRQAQTSPAPLRKMREILEQVRRGRLTQFRRDLAFSHIWGPVILLISIT